MMIPSLKNRYFAYFLMYNFYFLSFSLFSTLISVYMLDMGFQAAQVSLVVSVSFFASMLVQPVMGVLNDTIGTKRVSLASFILIILGAIYFMQARDLLGLTLGYSFVLMLINGVTPVTDMIAARSPYTYGKIRIWGTLGYAMGSQLAGLIYEYVSPQAIFIVFILTMLISIFGIIHIDIPHEKRSKAKKKDKDDSYIVQIFQNKTYLFYLLIVAIYSGVGNTGHTYIPSMLEHSGLSVGLASTIVSIAVVCESPLSYYSYIFMDRLSSKKLLYLSMLFLAVQYLIYGLDLGLSSKIVMTLAAKHTTGMLLSMVNLKVIASLVNEKYIMTALALSQTVRSLGSIFMQNIAGNIIDNSGYEAMSFFLLGMTILGLVMLFFIRLPKGPKKSLFS